MSKLFENEFCAMVFIIFAVALGTQYYNNNYNLDRHCKIIHGQKVCPLMSRGKPLPDKMSRVTLQHDCFVNSNNITMCKHTAYENVEGINVVE